MTFFDDRNNVLGDGVATTDIWIKHSHNGGSTWRERHLHGPFKDYLAPTSFFAPRIPRGLFLGDYVGLETISGNSVINFFTSTMTDGADVRSIRADLPQIGRSLDRGADAIRSPVLQCASAKGLVAGANRASVSYEPFALSPNFRRMSAPLHMVRHAVDRHGRLRGLCSIRHLSRLAEGANHE